MNQTSHLEESTIYLGRLDGMLRTNKLLLLFACLFSVIMLGCFLMGVDREFILKFSVYVATGYSAVCGANLVNFMGCKKKLRNMVQQENLHTQDITNYLKTSLPVFFGYYFPFCGALLSFVFIATFSLASLPIAGALLLGLLVLKSITYSAVQN